MLPILAAPKTFHLSGLDLLDLLDLSKVNLYRCPLRKFYINVGQDSQSKIHEQRRF